MHQAIQEYIQAAMFITKNFEEQISYIAIVKQISDIILVFPPTPTLIPLSPSHSKWTHNCRSSGETVTNCRESPIYDVSSDHPFRHLFPREILPILGFSKIRQIILKTLREEAWQWIVLRSQRLNWPHFTTIVHHSTPQFMTVVYHPH